MFWCTCILLLGCLTSLSQSQVTDSELSLLVQTIWNSDTNRLKIGRDVILNLQSQTYSSNTVDRARERLFTSVINLNSKSTYKKFITLLDNYEPYTHKTDRANSEELQEQQTFISSILGTTVWQKTRDFLTEKGYVQSYQELESTVKSMWFREYSRSSGVTGSSGFEHVFLGEFNSNKQEVSGFHSWVTTYLKEQQNELNYMGYLQYDSKNSLYKIKLTHGRYEKYSNSMFIGTSPEFEMALYTICFITRPDALCRFNLNGDTVTVKTYKSYNHALATAYPAI